MDKKRKVLFVSQNKTKLSFVSIDLAILKKNYDVRIIDFKLTKSSRDKFITFYRLLSGVLWADMTFSWFADVHAYWTIKVSKVLRKKSIVIVGGYEVAKEASMDYGLLLNPKLEGYVKYVFSNASKVLAVDNGLRNDAISNLRVDAHNILTVPTGYDFLRFVPNGEKEDLILTICACNSWNRVQLKGLDTFLESANYLSHYSFLIIGVWGNALKRLKTKVPQNVKIISYVPTNELIPYYQKAKVYCQLSKREGLPNALCEAMLCECVPVGTDVPGIHTAIGNTGFYVPYGDVNATVDALKMAIVSDKGQLARDRIKNLFPLEKRESQLIEIIDGMLHD